MRVGSSSELTYTTMTPSQQTTKAGTAEGNQEMDSVVLNEQKQENDRKVVAETVAISDHLDVMSANSTNIKDQIKNIEPLTFEQFAKEIGLDELGLSDKDTLALKKGFDQAVKLDESGKIKEADAAWDKLMSDVDDQFDAYDLKSFGQEMKELGFSDNEVQSMKKQYAEILKLDRAGKYDEAEKLWESLDEAIFEKESELSYEDFADEFEIGQLNFSREEEEEVKSIFLKLQNLLNKDKDKEANKLWENLMSKIQIKTAEKK